MNGTWRYCYRCVVSFVRAGGRPLAVIYGTNNWTHTEGQCFCCKEHDASLVPYPDSDVPAGLPAIIASRESVALLRLLTSASLMRLTIKERATFLTKTTDWERLEDAMRSAELVLGDYTHNEKGQR